MSATTSSRISATFEALRDENRLAFMPFITAGDPDLPVTARLVHMLAERNVDLIEIGFPYSDPIADGPVIQSSYTRALARHIKIDEIFGTLANLDHKALPPLVGMVSYALIFRYGTEAFLERAVAAGLAGLIVPDLPADEMDEFAEQVRDASLDLIQLIAPTTSEERAKQILSVASGFVYCISVSGVTGERQELPSALKDQLTWLRTQTDLPLAVGFGISQPEQVGMLREVADGIIVGSAIVRRMEHLTGAGDETDAVLQSIGDFVSSMVDAMPRS